jgi:hypothetical protein
MLKSERQPLLAQPRPTKHQRQAIDDAWLNEEEVLFVALDMRKGVDNVRCYCCCRNDVSFFSLVGGDRPFKST